MKFRLIAIVMISLSFFKASGQQTLSLMPLPRQISLQQGEFAVTDQFAIAVEADAQDTILYKAVNRFYQALNLKSSLYFIQRSITPAGKQGTASMRLRVGKKSEFVPGVDESYKLEISANEVVLEAPNTIGALRGLETLYQLCSRKADKFYFPALSIQDAPRFAWRGLMIDVSRHFIPMESIKRNVEAMAEVKMNVLHIHLSDNEGFRIESRVLPLLHQKGSNGQYYTQTQIKELIEFARERGIMVVPEFDMPSHALSWFPGYPVLSSSPGPFEPGAPFDFSKLPKRDLMSIMQFVQTSPFPAIDPSKDSTYLLLEKFIAEMSALFPSPYIHIGADENNGVVWKNNPDIVKFMEKNKIPDTHALQAYFVNRMFGIIRKYHKRPVGWEELFTKGITNDITVQVWQNAVYATKVLENNNPLLISRGFYLDLFMPSYIHYNNPDINIRLGNGKPIGGEAAQWTEAADASNVEARIWPRNAAIAERFWSDSSVVDVEDMYRRLFVVSHELDRRGLQHIIQYQQGIRRLAGEADVNAIEDFLDVLSPVKGYKKLFSRFTAPEGMLLQTAPLNEVSDVVLVDNPARWKFHHAVLECLNKKDSASFTVVAAYLEKWNRCAAELEGPVATQAQLVKVNTHLQNLKKASEIGLEALSKIKTGQSPSAEWIQEKTSIVASANKPQAETEISILGDILSLVKQQAVPLPATYPVF